MHGAGLRGSVREGTPAFRCVRNPHGGSLDADIPGMRASRIMAALAAAALIVVLVPSVAHASQLGDMVDYDLVFPVEGDHHLADTFWAGRSHGIHHAQDIMADKMTPVLAAADGVVRLVNWTAREHMNPDRCCSLVIRHDDGWESRYIHLDNDTTGTDDGRGWGIKRAIRPGVRVEAGQHIAWVGDSGNAEDTPPHLHFELYDPSGTIVNPFAALVAAGGNDVGGGARDPIVSGARVLKVGVVGADVRALQVSLAQLGYDPGPPDGHFGPRTAAAVTRLQGSVGIAADGVVGRVTKAAIAGLHRDDSDAAVLSVGSRGAAVSATQRALLERGFDAGPVDGIFGPVTLEAVVSFQKYQRLYVDGLVGPRTKASLGIL